MFFKLIVFITTISINITNTFYTNFDSIEKPQQNDEAVKNIDYNNEINLNENNYASLYFSNLNTNFGYNKMGSCTFVAADMLLSFYDTYWDDDVIDEKYEQNVFLEENTTIFDCENSPGTINEYNFNSKFKSENFTVDEYWDYIVENKDKIFHSYLIYLGQITTFSYKEGNDGKLEGVFLYTLKHILEYFFGSFDPFTLVKKFNINYLKSDPNEMREKIIENVKQGIPVIVDVYTKDWNSGHSFIAYDYDESNDEIICHAGWLNVDNYDEIVEENPNTTVTMNQIGYTEIYEILYLTPNFVHSHSNNYLKINENNEIENFCSCVTRYPVNLTVKDYYLDELPTFRWNSLINEKWYSDIGLKFQFSILNANRVKIVEINNLTKNYYKLKNSDFIQAIDSFSDNFYIKIGVVPTKEDVNGYDDIFLLKEFKEPSTYLFKTQIKPHEWGIHPRYYFQSEIDENEYYKYTTIVKGGISISTQRLRCGYIENRFINLSPRREDAGYAYFQMDFDVPIYSFMFGVCLWSDYEYLDNATLKVKNSNNEWVDFINITDELELKTKEEGVNRYHYLFDEGIYGLKFECYAEAIGDRNKGRLCIDDIVLCKEKDLFYNRYYGTNYES